MKRRKMGYNFLIAFDVVLGYFSSVYFYFCGNKFTYFSLMESNVLNCLTPWCLIITIYSYFIFFLYCFSIDDFFFSNCCCRILFDYIIIIVCYYKFIISKEDLSRRNLRCWHKQARKKCKWNRQHVDCKASIQLLFQFFDRKKAMQFLRFDIILANNCNWELATL